MSQSTINTPVDDRKQIDLADVEVFVLKYLTPLALFSVITFNHMHIETNDKVKLAGALELLLRLGGTAVAGAIGAYCFLKVKKIRDATFSLPGLWVLLVGLCLTSATVFAPFKSDAIAHLITFWCVVIFSPAALYVCGARRTIEIVIASTAFAMIASWFLYLAMPEYGVIIEITNAAGDGIERFGGISHPNVLAGSLSLGLVTLIWCYTEKKFSAWLTVPLILLSILTLYFTCTRVAVIAITLAMLVVYRGFWFRKQMFPIAGVGVLVALVVAMIVFADDSKGLFSTSAAESLTKSGSVEEITSLTGRAVLWEYAYEKIQERPFRGFGPGSPKYYLYQEDMLLHFHNVVISMAFCGGIFAGLFTAAMYFHQLIIAVLGKYKLAALITIVVFLNSITEHTIFDYIPGEPTVLWLMALYWPALDDGSL